MKILFLSQWFPYPPNNGSKIRIYNLLRGLAVEHSVTLVCFTMGESEEPNLEVLRTLCREIYVLPWRSFNPRGVRAIFGFLSSKPRYVVDTFSMEMQALVTSLISGSKYDLVIASQLGLAGYANAFQGLPALFEEVEQGVFYQRYLDEHRLIHRLRNGLSWLKQRRYTAGLLRNFKAATVVSQPELNLLRRVAPNFQAVEVIPNGICLEDYKGSDNVEPCPNDLIFTGSLKFAPNLEAMRWFLDRVYPQVLTAVPDARLTITGDSTGIPLSTSNGVILTGFVENIRPLVAASWASVVPILSGGGTRLKILEAMALKTPVIATSKGAEGLDVQHGKNILIADSPEAFARAVINLMKDPEMRQHLSKNAYQLVAEKYDWTVTMPRFLRLVESTAAAK